MISQLIGLPFPMPSYLWSVLAGMWILLKTEVFWGSNCSSNFSAGLVILFRSIEKLFLHSLCWEVPFLATLFELYFKVSFNVRKIRLLLSAVSSVAIGEVRDTAVLMSFKQRGWWIMKWLKQGMAHWWFNLQMFQRGTAQLSISLLHESWFFCIFWVHLKVLSAFKMLLHFYRIILKSWTAGLSGSHFLFAGIAKIA